MKSNISGRSGFGLHPNHPALSGQPRAVTNIPPTKVITTKSNVAMIHPTNNPVNVLPMICRPLRLFGSLKAFLSSSGTLVGILVN